MSIIPCPYCKEDIQSRALICKHCNSKLQPTLQEMVMGAISERIKANAISIPTQASPSRALCYAKYADDKVRLNECLERCEEMEAVAYVAERLNRRLYQTFQEYVWGGGDIDPVPFEKFVLERFTQPMARTAGPRLKRA